VPEPVAPAVMPPPLPPEAQPDPLDALADSMAAVTRTEASAALSRHGPRANAPDAVASLVLGIMSVFVPCLGPGLAIFAIAAGNKAKQAIRRSQWKFAGEGLATAGIVMGIITLCAYAIGTVITIGLDLV
jgi:cytochrome c biogenesis protein CcdA